MKKNILCTAVLLLSPAGLAATAATEADYISNARQLVFEGARSGEGYFSADGKKLVFQSEREQGNPFYQIYTLDLETGDTQRISPGAGKTTCAWIRPGTGEVLFASTHADPEAKAKMQAEIDFRASGKQRRYAWDYDASMDLYLASPDGSTLERLTDAPGYDAEASISPDGKQIVFCSLRGAYPLENLSEADRKLYELDPASFGDLYIMNIDGTDVRRLTAAPGYDGGPFFSADGSRIIFRRFDKTGTMADVYSIKPDGTDEKRLTEFGAMSWAPFYHPSGRYVIFASNKLGFANFELFIVDAEGQKQPVRVTFTSGFDGLATFSPDGSKLSWTSGRTGDGKSQIFLADWNHQAALAALDAAPKRETKHASTAPATPPATSSIKQDAQFLASDELEGRLTGSPGACKAAEFLAQRLSSLGAQPIDDTDLLKEFEFSTGVEVDKSKTNATLTSGETSTELKLDQDFRPLAFSATGEVSGPIVFAGYGLVLPGGEAHGYDSYAGVDVKDKIALVLRYVPESVDAQRRAELNRYAGLRYKALAARERGAKALLVVTGPNSPGAGELVPLSVDRDGSSGIPVISISGELAKRLLDSAGQDLKALQDRLDKEDPHAPSGIVIPGSISLRTEMNRKRSKDHNVVAVFPPDDTANAEYVMLGAHYDHLGHGEVGAMNRAGEEGQVHNGADDNASGTAVVLEIARQIATKRAADPSLRKRGLVVSFWSGEEMGLLGSSAFAEHPAIPLERVTAYLNFDMVGRLRDNKLVLQGAGSSNAWIKMIERRNVAAGFSLTVQNDPYLPTDSTAFYTKGVPVLNFFTGSHDDYHRPGDDADKLNEEGMNRIATFASALTADLLRAENRPDYQKVAPGNTGGGGRETLRVYIGSIPDYAQEVEGVKLSGVRAGSPAEKAGLQAGDILIEFAGQQVKNIYDYTYALDAAKPDVELTLKVRRAGEVIELKVTPTTRRG